MGALAGCGNEKARLHSQQGFPPIGYLLPLRAEGGDHVGVLEDARSLGMAGTVEAALDACARLASCEGPGGHGRPPPGAFAGAVTA